MVTLLYFARLSQWGGRGVLLFAHGRYYVPVLERDCLAKTSVAYPDPVPDPPDPHVFRPPGSGSGSIIQRYGSGSGSFYYQAKIV